MPSGVAAIIVAAGSSQRMGGQDKLFLPLGKLPVLARAVEPFQRSELVRHIVLVVNRSNHRMTRALVERLHWTKVAHICLGGPRRQDSVARGLSKLTGCEWVVVHDGARPFVSEEMVRRGLEAARQTGASVAAVPVKDTIKIAGEDGLVRETPPRKDLWIAQTPQVFRFDIISNAYAQAGEESTDDAVLVERLGYRVRLFPGSYGNIKITTPEDLRLAQALLEGMNEQL
jgi:2-C-methyl-D-erythritol 4-phosphate cytidylyltransferase